MASRRGVSGPENRDTFVGMRAVLACLIASSLIGCSKRGELAVDPAAASVGQLETVIVSTTRAPVAGPPFFAQQRSYGLHFARFDVSVPPDREPGTVEFPHRLPPDPRTEFVVASHETLPDERAFIRVLNEELAASGNDEGFLFVHGYNTNFAEGLYRQAQLQFDMQRHGAMVHFAWPSSASLLEYVQDRESALFSRDELEATINALAKSNAREVNLIGHSMGTFLLMDTLRTMSRSGHDRAFDKIAGVVLLSADVDIDVFRKQAPHILAKGVPIYLVTSQGDRALKMSAIIRGERDRLGSN